MRWMRTRIEGMHEHRGLMKWMKTGIDWRRFMIGDALDMGNETQDWGNIS